MAKWLEILLFTIVLAISVLIPFLNRDACARDSGSNEPDLGRVLIITAHPDDETMFFAPSILSLVAQNITVEALCLSNGDSEGLGSIRQHELHEAYSVLGVQNIHILDHPQLRDNITLWWDNGLLARVVQEYLEHHEITTILTFDEYGVSGHPNHVSIPKAVASAINTNAQAKLKAYSLVTHTLLIKYSGVLAPFFIRLGHVMGFGRNACATAGTYSSNLAGYLTALRAMRKHRSQLVWFRWLYLMFSRYMWVNDWVPLKVSVISREMRKLPRKYLPYLPLQVA